MKSIIDLKDDKFFKHKITKNEEYLYRTLTTGEAIGDVISKVINKLSKIEQEL